jgi:hypothetical protein
MDLPCQQTVEDVAAKWPEEAQDDPGVLVNADWLSYLTIHEEKAELLAPLWWQLVMGRACVLWREEFNSTPFSPEGSLANYTWAHY